VDVSSWSIENSGVSSAHFEPWNWNMSFVDFSLSLSIYLLIDLSLLINPFLSLDQSID